jgi:hypothetical protein
MPQNLNEDLMNIKTPANDFDPSEKNDKNKTMQVRTVVAMKFGKISSPRSPRNVGLKDNFKRN